jgi:hypothetical protein
VLKALTTLAAGNAFWIYSAAEDHVAKKPTIALFKLISSMTMKLLYKPVKYHDNKKPSIAFQVKTTLGPPHQQQCWAGKPRISSRDSRVAQLEPQ